MAFAVTILGEKTLVFLPSENGGKEEFYVMAKKTVVLITIGILAVIICLQVNLAYGESYEENIKKSWQ
jgi:hypothetical protein